LFWLSLLYDSQQAPENHSLVTFFLKFRQYIVERAAMTVFFKSGYSEKERTTRPTIHYF
jgi:hypothetical protein